MFFIVFFSLVFFLFGSPSFIQAQENSIWCDSMCNTTSIQCDQGFRVPDQCLGEDGQPSGNCCRILAGLGIGGSCDASGMCSCDQFIACVEDTGPPPPAPNCPTDWECLAVDQPSCDFYSGEFTACYISDGVNGTCCRPPQQALSPCVNGGGYCRPPSEQPSPGECAWNETEWYAQTYSCELFGSPPGTLCCDSAPVIPCSTVGSDATCRDACSDDEFAYASVTDCKNPQAYPPSGYECCLLKSTTPLFDMEIFCDGEGNPTTNPASGKIYTAIGCIPVRTNSAFLVAITAWAVRIAAGIAFIMIVVAGFLTMTAGGDPQKVQAARELLTAVITGLLLILLSGFLLRTIGVDLLGIPGL
jgi:hypothetical protein